MRIRPRANCAHFARRRRTLTAIRASKCFSQSAERSFFRPLLERLEDRVVLNYAVTSTPIQWVELNSDPNATNLIGTGEDWANPIDLGSNTINFYGTTYSGFGGPSGIWASTNGLITFGSRSADFRNGDLLTDPGQAAISPLWSSYFNFDPSTPMVLSEIDPANNRLIIEWNQVKDTVTYSNPITFEAIIQLNTGSTPGNIIFNYLQLDYYLGSGASVGIKDGGTQGPNAVVISVNTVSPLVNINQAILFAWQSAVQTPSISSLSANTASEGSSDSSRACPCIVKRARSAYDRSKPSAGYWREPHGTAGTAPVFPEAPQQDSLFTRNIQFERLVSGQESAAGEAPPSYDSALRTNL